MLPNVGRQIVHVKIAGITRSSLFLYVSRLRVKVWMNTSLEEIWVDLGEVPDWKHPFQRREDYLVVTVHIFYFIFTFTFFLHNTD